MPQSITAVQKAIKGIRTYIDQVNRKKKIPTRDFESSPYFLMDSLKKCVPAFLTRPEAMDLLVDFIPEIESFRGKGSQTMQDDLEELLRFTIREYQYEFLRPKNSKIPYPEANAFSAFQKIARLALPRAVGDRKPLRSRRAAESRKQYWDFLTDLSEYFLIPEALPLAKEVAPDEKRSLPEREGALDFLLAHQTILRETEGKEEDPEIDAILGALRDDPPSRDILFLILNDGVESGQISEMSALVELEDFDEENER